MPGSTGPILAIGAITVVNQSIVHGQPVDWRVPIATGLAALAIGGLENGIPQFSDAFVKLSWMALLTTLIVRVKAGTPSPLESFVDWYNKK